MAAAPLPETIRISDQARRSQLSMRKPKNGFAFHFGAKPLGTPETEAVALIVPFVECFQ